jgi:mono/diheme cytochrome c family protein
MALVVFVLFWIVVAVVLVLLAFRGGSQAARARRQAASRRGNGVVILGFLVALLVLGVLIPLGVFRSDRDSDSIPEASVTQLTSVQQHGQALFGTNCRQCHTLKAYGAAGVVGPNLDELKPPKATVVRQVNNGGGPMPAFKGQLTPDEIKAVSQYVESVAGK